jgi:transposase
MRRSRATVDLFEEIRREYEFGTGTIAGLARKFGVHRRLIREALGSAIPKESTSLDRPRPRVAPVTAFIDGILEADRQAPRKQRHTAHRIYVRLTRERPELPIAESTVRRHVRERREVLGLLERQTFVPQHYVYGAEAQVDWYGAVAEVGGQRETLQAFTMRSMASGGAFHRAYRRGTQQAFLEGHELAFLHFGGGFRRVRYDNLTLAVKKVLRGSRREETERFHAFRSHWRFESIFCLPGKEGAHEKGGVEGEVGSFRRNHWVPVPTARDLEDLNRQLLAGCREDEHRTITGRDRTVGAAMLLEHLHLVPLVGENFELAEIAFPTVSKLGMVRVRANAYSVPLPAGTRVQAKILAATIELWYEGRRIAQHERCYGRQQEILDLEHYLDVLEHKPGALAGSKPLDQWRQSGLWPASYDRFWEGLIERHGPQGGTKQMIRLLHLGREHGQRRLRAAIDEALAVGCGDAAAVEHLMNAGHLARRRPEPLDVGALLAFERPLPGVTEYDQLLKAGAR